MGKKPVSFTQAWRQAEPYQRRNIVLSGFVIVWAGILYWDMSNLKKDPVVVERFKLDEKPTPDNPGPFSAFYARWTRWLRPKDDGNW